MPAKWGVHHRKPKIQKNPSTRLREQQREPGCPVSRLRPAFTPATYAHSKAIAAPWPPSFRKSAIRLVTPAAAATAAAAGATLLRLVAVAAVHRTIATRLKRHRGLLPAPGADHCCSSGLRPLVSAATAATALFVLLCLAAGFAALGCGIPALLEERLVFARKGEFLTAVATGELQIASHGESSFPLYAIIHESRGLVNRHGNLYRDERTPFFAAGPGPIFRFVPLPRTRYDFPFGVKALWPSLSGV
jgi:hypothetical protein